MSRDPEIIVVDADYPQDLQKMQDSIEKLLEAGMPAQSIAMQLKLSPEKVEAFATKRDKAKWETMTHAQIKDDHLTTLNRTIETAQYQYIAEPNPPNAYALSTLISIALKVIDDIEKKGDPRDKKNQIDYEVLQPMISTTIQMTAQELSKVRTELLQYLPNEYHNAVKQFTESIITSLGLILKAQHRSALDRMDKPLGIADDSPTAGGGVGRPLKQSIAKTPNIHTVKVK